eukprot:GHUV01028681.1.p1 GENE.GHUV01028681.1~~GHUV01028681.1.p1  ORF type:complete len:152 (-),score=34.56 GHUV01028681.1:121-576(-)
MLSLGHVSYAATWLCRLVLDCDTDDVAAGTPLDSGYPRQGALCVSWPLLALLLANSACICISGCDMFVLCCHVYAAQVLECDTDDVAAGTPLDIDLAAQVAAFGRRYVTTDSVTALQYYMLAAALAGGGRQEQGRLFRELLVQSKDYGGYI